jgi:acyl carrier protein
MMTATKRVDVEQTVRSVLRDVLSIDAARADAFTASTELFGALPELDSMAVAGLLTELEDRLGIVIDDDDVDGDLLATFGSLTDYATRKVAG